MKVAISTSVIQRGKTGIAEYVFSLVNTLASLNEKHQFTLFVMEEDLPFFDFVKSKMEIIPVSERYRSPVKNILWHQFELPRLVRKHKIDVLHVPSYRRLLWSHPCALVSTIHDLAPFHVANKYDWKRMFYGRVIVKRLARRQHETIAISKNTAADIERFFKLPQKNLSVVYNGLNHERFFPASKDEAKKNLFHQFGLEYPFFLYVARLEHPAKNHVRLIEAFDRFKRETNSNWHLVFGGSDWHGAEVIHDRIRRSPFVHQIHSLGFVAPSELPNLYRAADIFIYPSLYEGFGFPPIEAMACGTPVISSTRGALAEVVSDAALIINPEDVGSITDQMRTLSLNATLRGQLRQAGFVRSNYFTWEKAAKETLAVYQRALARQNSVARAGIPVMPWEATKI